MTKCRVLASKTDCALLLNNSQNVLFGQNQILDVVDLVLGAAVLGEQHLVAGLDVHRHAPAVVVQAALADGQDEALHRALFAGRVGQEDPALGLRLAIRRLDHYTVSQRPNAKISCHSRCPSVSSNQLHAALCVHNDAACVWPRSYAPGSITGGTPIRVTWPQAEALVCSSTAVLCLLY